MHEHVGDDLPGSEEATLKIETREPQVNIGYELRCDKQDHIDDDQILGNYRQVLKHFLSELLIKLIKCYL